MGWFFSSLVIVLSWVLDLGWSLVLLVLKNRFVSVMCFLVVRLVCRVVGLMLIWFVFMVLGLMIWIYVVIWLVVVLVVSEL